MSMTAGTVTVNQSTGAVSKSGMAGAIYDSMIASVTVPPDNQGGIAVKTGIANICSAVADGVVSHILANAEVIVSVAGLQTYVVPPAAASPTGPPVSPVSLKVL